MVGAPAPREGAFQSHGVHIAWQNERLSLVQGDRRSEIGPGEGEQWVIQLSRSASWAPLGFIGRLFRRKPRKILWLVVQLRFHRGAPPIYLRARALEGLDLSGIPVLPAAALELESEVLLDFLAACARLEVKVASWAWDGTEDVPVIEDPMAPLQPLLDAPSPTHWVLLCEHFDALETSLAQRVLPRLRSRLHGWPDALRVVDPTASVRELVERKHSHLQLSRVLNVLALEEDSASPTLKALASSPQLDHVSELVLHGQPGDEVPMTDLLQSQYLGTLLRLKLHGFDLSTIPFSRFLIREEVSRLEHLALVGVARGPRGLSCLPSAPGTGSSGLEQQPPAG